MLAPAMAPDSDAANVGASGSIDQMREDLC
jgi:hypothetical protein